ARRRSPSSTTHPACPAGCAISARRFHRRDARIRRGAARLCRHLARRGTRWNLRAEIAQPAGQAGWVVLEGERRRAAEPGRSTARGCCRGRLYIEGRRGRPVSRVPLPDAARAGPGCGRRRAGLSGERAAVGGFGLIAWPVEYGTSSVMTFIVNQDGVVWQR